MSELFEPFKMGDVHLPEDPKCPFCPKHKKYEHYKTYGGILNDGGKLGTVVDEPDKFGTTTESDARPKNGEVGKDLRQNQAPADSESLSDVKKGDVDWKFQAHHAISGNQCLKGDPVEQFILEGERLKFDTGYSVNNPQNGVWLPSFPEAGVSWPEDPAEKFKLAKIAMSKFGRQFHLGHHNIPVDEDGMDPETDEKYVDYVRGQLKDLFGILQVWELHCPEVDEEKKHLGNTTIHRALDALSAHIIAKLKGEPRHWTIFVSRHARDYTIKARDPTKKLSFERQESRK